MSVLIVWAKFRHQLESFSLARFDSWVGKICWRRDRLPSPVFLGFIYDSAGKESHLQCERPGFNPWVGKIPGLPHCMQTLYGLSHQGSPKAIEINKNRQMGLNQTYKLLHSKGNHKQMKTIYRMGDNICK